MYWSIPGPLNEWPGKQIDQMKRVEEREGERGEERGGIQEACLAYNFATTLTFKFRAFSRIDLATFRLQVYPLYLPLADPMAGFG